jgi:hypothetical protein
MIKHHLEYKRILFYNRCVDNILMIFDSSKTTPEQIVTYMNNVHHHLAFKLTYEENNTVSYLDLTLTRHNTSIITSIFRKPTATDTTVHHTSNHPLQHKLAAFRFLVNRMQILPLTQEARKQEIDTIRHIAINKGYLVELINKLLHKNISDDDNTTEHSQQARNKKWITFRYHSPLVRKVANIFKNSNLQIAYQATNTLGKVLNANNNNVNKCTSSGIYSLKCSRCNHIYVGQTDRDLKQGLKNTTAIYARITPSLLTPYTF